MAYLEAVIIITVINRANDKEEANGKIQISRFENLAVGY
jgi:hypothetical protein